MILLHLILTILAYALAAFCKGIADTLQFHFMESVFNDVGRRPRFWNPKLSWENKYKRDKSGHLVQPLKPRFPGSTTFLVFLTDGWHLFEALRNVAHAASLCLLGSALITLPVLAWLAVLVTLVYVIHAGAFHLAYTVIFIKKTSK